MRKNDIIKLIKRNREHVERLEKIRRDGEVLKKTQEGIQEDIQRANDEHRERVQKELADLKRFNQERGDVAQIKLSKLRQGDDETRQRYANEVLTELDGVNDPDQMIKYYEMGKKEAPKLKQDEAARVIKNKLWKSGDEVKLHNFKERLVNDLPEKEKSIRKDLAEARVLEGEIELFANWFNHYSEETMQGQASEDTERALLVDFADPAKIERKTEEGLPDTF